MKIKDNFMLRQIRDDWVVVPMGERLTEFNGIIKLNETGAFIWRLLEYETTKEKILSAILAEYDIDDTNALKEIVLFLNTLKESDLLETAK